MSSTDAPPVNAVARAERAALCDLLLEVGPEAATLCEGWTTRDLAAHLVVREGRPDASIGVVVDALSGWTKRVQDGYAERDYADLVGTVRSGPPRWNMMSIAAVDAQANTVEYFVHHEDVRRCVDGWTPRELDEATVTALWERLEKAGKFFARKSPVGLVLAPTDGPAAGTHLTVKDGEPSVTLRGPVGEILLAVYGRKAVELQLEGDDEAVAAFLA